VADIIQFPEQCNVREFLQEFVTDVEQRNVRSLAIVWVDRDAACGTAHLVESRDFNRVIDGMRAVLWDITPEEDEDDDQ
jgi:hypothetical protein